ncbi:MAG: nucleotide exchange factor GrpE [Angustibacter sp.]
MSEAPQGDVEVTDGEQAPVVRDRRRIDPETGQVRDPGGGSALPTDSQPADSQPPDSQPADVSSEASDLTDGTATSASPNDVTPDAALAAERLADLQRLQAEYVNYRKRVERDRDVARDRAVASVLESLLAVMDDVHLARQHGDLEGGPFAAIADKLEAALGRYGLERFGEPGEAFDPEVHEALMHTDTELADGTEVTTVVQVLQPGYRTGERILRAARVAVADPS